MDIPWRATSNDRELTARPGFLIVQWRSIPDQRRREELLAAMRPVPKHTRTLKTATRMVEFFFDNPDISVETPQTIATTTSQNVDASAADLSFLGARTQLEDRTKSLGTAFRNESLIYIDKESLEVSVLTDPIGFSKVFHLQLSDARLISSNIAHLVRLSHGVDQNSVISFLLNGSPLSNRTVFQGITTMRRACAHRFTAANAECFAYWDYAPRNSAEPNDLVRLQAVLWEAIVESIRSQCAGKRVLLPLSGGFDSSVILGVLGKILQHRDVVCFSYSSGPAVPGSDAHVAKRQAAVYNYQHINLDISGTSLIDVLELNREAGQIQRGPCLEISAYADLKKMVGDDAETVMPFGDEFFGGGWSSFALSRDEDVLGAVYLRSPEGLDLLGKYVGPHNLSSLKSGLTADYRELIETAPGSQDLYVARERIYLDYRISMNLLPLRTFSVGHWFDVCAPLLDVSIIDQIALLTPELRANKAFFKEMSHAFLPEIFANTRSSHRQAVPALGEKLGDQFTQLVTLAEREQWQIPGLIEADEIVDLIRRAAENESRRPSLRSRMEVTARQLLSGAGILEGVKRLRYRYARPFDERPDRLTVLTRLFSLAQQMSGAQRS